MLRLPPNAPDQFLDGLEVFKGGRGSLGNPKDSVWEDWGTLGKIRGITTPPRILLKIAMVKIVVDFFQLEKIGVFWSFFLLGNLKELKKIGIDKGEISSS